MRAREAVLIGVATGPGTFQSIQEQRAAFSGSARGPIAVQRRATWRLRTKRARHCTIPNADNARRKVTWARRPVRPDCRR